MSTPWPSFDDTSPNESTSPFPASWKIAPSAVLNGDTEAIAKCPKESATFIAFIITNAIVTIFGLIIGCRPVLNKISRDHLGKLGKKNTSLYNWIPPLLLHISTNAFTGIMIYNTPGYGNVKIINAMMIYFVRPRISVIALATMAAFFKTHNDYPWMYALLANTVAEFMLQVIAGTQSFPKYSISPVVR
jgi:hypothetical protein